jgi:hypothetical protein
MKRRRPKSKLKRKLKGHPELQPSSAVEQVLTHGERDEPANIVELQAETAEPASISVEAQNETEDLSRTSETPVEQENSVAPVEHRDETVDSATTTIETQTENENIARSNQTQAEIEKPAAPLELREDTEDSASTVELRGEIEDLESIIDIQVEVEDSSHPAEIREVTSTSAGPPEIDAAGEIPTSPVAIPAATEKPPPQQSAPHSAPRTSADRRAHPRYAFTAAIEVVAAEPDAQLKSQVRDLSQQGCYVDTDTPFALGTATELRIAKGATTFEARARVVFNQTGKGMGLMFIAVAPQHLRTLDTWIAESRESSWRAANRRRSQRVLMKVPVRVSGKAADGESFEVETHTLSISPHGALLVLAPAVQRGQRFILANVQTKSALECVVAHLEPSPGAPTQVGVEFSLPNPAFWRVAFPPKDWTPRHPDAKSR